MSAYTHECCEMHDKIMVSDCWKDSTVVRADGAEIEVVDDFCYLGAIYRTMKTVTKNAAKESGKH